MKPYALSALFLLAAPVAAMAGGMAVPAVEPQVAAPVAMTQSAPAVDWTGFYSGVSLGFGHTYNNGAGQDATMHIGSVNLGYRTDIGPVVVGGELSYSKDNVNVTAGDGVINSTTGLKMIVGKSLGRTLVYGTVGLAQSEATLSGVKGTDTGYSAGIGADYALNQQWTVGGEVTANRYFDFNGSGLTLKDTAVAVKVGYRF